MRSRTILIMAACLAILAGLGPMVAIAYLARERATDIERVHLEEYARWTLMRADRALADARQALRTVEAGGAQDCSPRHTLRMRRAALDAQGVESIGLLRDGRIACSSADTFDQPARGIIAQRLAGGFVLVVGARPGFSQGQAMVAINHGAHSALIKPARLIDVLTDSEMTLGVATGTGRLIAVSGHADPRLLRKLSTRAVSGMDDTYIYASRRGPGLIAFAISKRADALADLQDDYLVLLPIGLLASALLIGIVIWVSRLRLSPEKELEIAIRKREFVAYYQPIIDLSTGRCVAAEALARWRRPNGAWAPPERFIPIAEATGLISALTDLMVARVVEDMADLLRADRDLHISINIPARDMESGRFLPVLTEALAQADIRPSQIWLEATEQGFMRADAAAGAVAAARAAGHLVAIDDFGTGYSSLSVLAGLPLDALKIDKSFVDAIARDAATSVVTPHIIDMAHSLHLRIIAEGVETIEQEAYLREAGVQLAQGWLYAKALPAEAFAQFRERRNAEPPALAENQFGRGQNRG